VLHLYLCMFQNVIWLYRTTVTLCRITEKRQYLVYQLLLHANLASDSLEWNQTMKWAQGLHAMKTVLSDQHPLVNQKVKYVWFSLSICLSFCLSVCRSVRLPAGLYVCLSICLSVCMSVWLSVCSKIFTFLFILPFVHPVRPFISLSVSTCVSVFLSVCLSVRLSVCLFVFLFPYYDFLLVSLSFSMSIYPTIHPSTCHLRTPFPTRAITYLHTNFSTSLPTT